MRVHTWVAVAAGLACLAGPSRSATWGRLANPGFVDQRMKATYFFPGQALDGVPRDLCALPIACLSPGCPTSVYTRAPLDPALLHWHESDANRQLALDQMVGAGINVINMSVWGEDFIPCAWAAYAAPMQDGPLAQDELFATAVGRPLLIVPALEERGPQSPDPWSFMDEVPSRPDGAVAPGAVSQIENLLVRYLHDPQHPEWADRWARVYDRDGHPRYAISIIHAASNRLGGSDDAAFAAGFDAIAARVAADGHEDVGFLIDALPRGTNGPGAFRASSGTTAVWLAQSHSVLAVECFASEVFYGSNDDNAVLSWKRAFSQGWAASPVPFIMDVSSGYDGRPTFQNGLTYGLSASWLCSLGQMVRDFGQAGVIYNSWNGYTEGMVAVPVVGDGNLYYDWVRSLQLADLFAQAPAAASRNGTWTCPYTFLEALAVVPTGGIVGLKAATSGSFSTAGGILTKPCTIISVGGASTITP